MSARLLLLLCVLLPAALRGQQLSQYTQYVFNHFSVNPAVAGSKDCLDVRLGYRKQWSGFDGAPTTGWASLHGTITPKGKPFQKNKHGVGMFIESDNAGHWGYTRLLLAYAYHIQMSQDYMISMGFFAGLKQFKLDLGELDPLVPGDPLLDNRASVMVWPEVWPGIWLYSKNGWAGLSMNQVLNNKVKNFGENTRLTRHFLLSAGRRIRLNRSMGLVGSTLLKYSPGSPIAMDINMMLEYKRKMGIGISYRNQDAIAAMIKVPFLKYFALGYSYDLTTSRLIRKSTGSHEVIHAIYPCGSPDPVRDIVRCPVFE